MYIGNPHLRPLSRLWRTDLGMGEYQSTSTKHVLGIRDFEDFHKLTESDPQEMGEVKIEKQALLEALFGTKLWNEPYVKNPFVYLTDSKRDFEGEQGIILMDGFKKIFYANYKKYNDIVEKVNLKVRNKAEKMLKSAGGYNLVK